MLVRDAATGKELLALRGLPGSGSLVGCSANGLYIAGTGGQVVKVWDASTGQLIRTLEGHSQAITGLSVSPDSQHLATCSATRTIRVWDLPTGQLRQVLEGHTHQVASIDFSPDGKRLVSGGWDRTLRLWDIISGQPIRTLRGHESWVLAVAFFPDGQRVIGGDRGRKLIVWDAASDQECRSLRIPIGAAAAPASTQAVRAWPSLTAGETTCW